ncbi:MAG TPA: hypothetical protein VFK81_19345 [Terriglobales bacterium]|nr:hypothetical protein [Terriglobales bacterium]
MFSFGCSFAPSTSSGQGVWAGFTTHENFTASEKTQDMTESTNNTEDEKQSGEEKGKKSLRKKKAEPKMREVRKRAVAVMCPAVSDIAKALTALAKKGNCQAAKLVFEFLAIFPPPQAEEEGDDTLARYLLRQLGIPDHPTEEEITKVLNGGSEANTGAVESS